MHSDTVLLKGYGKTFTTHTNFSHSIFTLHSASQHFSEKLTLSVDADFKLDVENAFKNRWNPVPSSSKKQEGRSRLTRDISYPQSSRCHSVCLGTGGGNHFCDGDTYRAQCATWMAGWQVSAGSEAACGLWTMVGAGIPTSTKFLSLSEVRNSKQKNIQKNLHWTQILLSQRS